MTNQELEAEFERALLVLYSPQERLYLSTHPELRLYAFLWYTRGWDAGEGRYRRVVEQVCDEFQSGGSVVGCPPPTSPK